MKKILFFLLLISTAALSQQKIVLRSMKVRKVTINGVTGTQYYVSTSGANTNGLSDATAWTLATAITKLNNGTVLPGDRVLLKRGDSFSSNMITLICAGTPGNPIYIGNYGSGALPKITGNGGILQAQIYILNRSYITFDGIDITDPTLASDTNHEVDAKIKRGIWVDGTSSNIKFINGSMSLIGVGLYWVGGNNTVDNCSIGNLRMVRNTPDDRDGDGIAGEPGNVAQGGDEPGNDDDYGANPIVMESANNYIGHSLFYDCWAKSYDYKYDGGSIEFTSGGNNNNLIEGNTFQNGVGFMEITGTSSGNVFRYNKFINNGSLFYFQSQCTFTGWKFHNNVIVQTTTPLVSETRMISGWMSGGTIDMKNNIWNLTNGVNLASNTTGLSHAKNIYKMSGGSAVGFSLDGSELNTSAAVWVSTSGDPINWNYHLTSGSPAIDFGAVIPGAVTDYAGILISGTPEAGIYEFVTLVFLGTDPSDHSPIRLPFYRYDAASKTIHLKANQADDFFLLNTLGQLVAKGYYRAGRSEIPIGMYAAGIYYLKTGRSTFLVNNL